MRLRFRGRVLGFNSQFATVVFDMPDSLRPTTLQDSIVYGENRTLVLHRSGAGWDSTVVPYLRVVSGDAADLAATDALVDRNSLSVTSDITGQGSGLFGGVYVEPRVFTPNGDNVNDEVVVFYDILRLLQPRPVEVSVYDLGGRRVRLIESPGRTTGGHSATWDGRDDAGSIVPPGVYVVRVNAEADAEQATVTRTVSVAY